MSSLNCESCDNLRETSPEYVLNGTTTAICNSLKNDTGLNPNLSTLHTNAEDLHDINDCTIGRLAQEIEGYDVCNWKEFEKTHVSNEYELLKAMICSEDGQWQNIHDLWDFARDVCQKADQALFPSGIAYGAFPYATNQNRVLGTINTKSGQPLLSVYDKSDVENPDTWPVVGPGIQLSVQTLSRCSDGACQKYVRVMPWFYCVYMNANVAIGDILWYARTSDLLAKTGVPAEFIHTFRRNVTPEDRYGGGWRWSQGTDDTTNHKQAWMRLHIDPENEFGEDYIVLVYEGSSYPVEAPGRQVVLGSDQGISFKTYIYSC